ncbi:winged helix-turn-helix transcriptional regulator [Microbacterium sp. VKM Ac-2870]|nr:winged helix-turn-helix transcriptional regulator [Microbacterium sp. VKM Ac-2870]
MRGRGAGGDSGDPAAADHAHDRFGPRGGRRTHPRGGEHGVDRGFGPPEGWVGMRGGGPAMRHGGPARLRLIEALHAASHPLSVSELGEAIGVDQPRASRLVQQSVEMGLVQREADPDDARRTRIALTETGERFARGFRGRRREYLTQALTDFTGEERAELARLLTKLAAAWPAG